MPQLTPEERVGQELESKYRLERLIGMGGMGAVFAARHLITDRPVAVKVLLPEFVGSEHLVTRFMTEARAAGRLRHPNVVEVIDVGRTDDDTVFMVLELLDGESLGERIERGPLSPAETLRALLPVMDALATAHDSNIVHRDIKPDNIFLSRDYHGELIPKLLDFGIAKLVEGKRNTLTNPGTIMGTPHYMAPEQAAGTDAVTGGVDVWSMGVVMYEALTGSLPFMADNLIKVLMKISTEDPEPLENYAPDVPRPLAEVIQRAITRDPAVRITLMPEFIDALIAAAEESGLDLPFDRLAPGSRSRGSTKKQLLALEATPEPKRAALTPTTLDVRTTVDAKRRRWRPIALVLAFCVVGAFAAVVLIGEGDTPVEGPGTLDSSGAASSVGSEPPGPSDTPEPGAANADAQVTADLADAGPDAGDENTPATPPGPRDRRGARMGRRPPGAMRTMQTMQADRATDPPEGTPMMTTPHMGFASDSIENSDEF